MNLAEKLLTVGMTTKNRPADLLRSVLSLGCLYGSIRELLIVDNGSEVPIEAGLREALPADFPVQIRVIRFDSDPGTCFSRNRIVELASTEYVLNLDDDIQMLSAVAVEAGVIVIQSDDRIGAVAFAQANQDGTSWPSGWQPSPAEIPVEITAFIGFAHLVRRSVFLLLGGYRVFLQYIAEEKEFCLRLLDAGFKVVYLPEARIVHFASRVERNRQRRLRLDIRNQLLADLMNMPAPLVPVQMAWHMALYFLTRRATGIADPWGIWHVLRETMRLLPEAVRKRKPIRFRTFNRWRRLRSQPIPYSVPSAIRHT